MNLILLNWLTLAIALSAFVYSNILTEPGQILNQAFDFLERHLPEWLFKPLMGCQYCVCGQWALWFYFYMCFIEHGAKYHWWLHLWFIMQTIFIQKIITYLYFKFLDK